MGTDMPASDRKDEEHRGHVPSLRVGLGGAVAAGVVAVVIVIVVVVVVGAAAAAAVVGASYNAAGRDAFEVGVRQRTWTERHVHSP